jgi:hypothetical protein
MLEFSIDTIRGGMVGIEFPVAGEIDDDIQWMAVIDLFILRFMLIRWKDEAS